MYRSGRSRFTADLKYIIGMMSILQITATTDYGTPIEIKFWDSQRNPLHHMIDVTNEFGLKVLAEHNFLNENNIAFSPYGLVGILVALYEGVDGESSYQIQRSMPLPWNRNVMRIGFRDIHRTLKTYFVPEEGFLAGLALNNENVTFNESYKKILKFYGFDLDQSSSNDTNMNTTNTSSTTETANNTSTSTENTPVTTPPTTEPSKEETTLNPNAETIDIRESMTATTSMTSAVTESAPQLISSTTPIAPVEETTSTTITASVPETTTIITSTITEQPTTQTPTDGSTMTTEMMTASLMDETESTPMGTSSTSDITTEVSPNADTEASTTQITTEMSSVSESETTEETTVTSIDSTIASTTPSPTPESLQRRKKSIVEFIYTNPPYFDHSLFRSFDVGIDLPNEYNDKDKMFLVNGLRNIQVSYMHYDSILEHAYLPHLEASALRLPLDSDRYYLLVVLPLRRGEGELARLLSRMARESDLSDVYAALRPRRVKAVVPSFTVKGHIALTTDLQKVGTITILNDAILAIVISCIRDVFEPRQTDFTPMTHLPGVYVRSIEQAVSVVIRKYQPDTLKNSKHSLILRGV
ncbi:unnamed protein product [Danaus chrysippus]|uniref:(African queen) hypothetical protein n=1 Tax=Danaus chrysippus TaxID=151541 RepID=A0A8J2R4Q8_9NEOP|nr:unnamed protein product [Danaus chrysippus]